MSITVETHTHILLRLRDLEFVAGERCLPNLQGSLCLQSCTAAIDRVVCRYSLKP